jgi:hypothetical protein
MPKKNIKCVTRKKKNDEKYVVCFDIYKYPKKTKSTMTKKKYESLLKKHKTKKLSKKEKKMLDNELFKKYCKCINTLKKSKNKKMFAAKYGICMNSIYKKRGIEAPYNVSKKCK